MKQLSIFDPIASEQAEIQRLIEAGFLFMVAAAKSLLGMAEQRGMFPSPCRSA